MSRNKRKKTRAELREEAIQQQWLKEHIKILQFNPERAQGMELDDEAVHVTTSFGPTFGRCWIQIDNTTRQSCSRKLSREDRLIAQKQYRAFLKTRSPTQVPQTPRLESSRTNTSTPSTPSTPSRRRTVPTDSEPVASGSGLRRSPTIEPPATPTRPRQSLSAMAYPTPPPTTKRAEKRKRDESIALPAPAPFPPVPPLGEAGPSHTTLDYREDEPDSDIEISYITEVPSSSSRKADRKAKMKIPRRQELIREDGDPSVIDLTLSTDSERELPVTSSTKGKAKRAKRRRYANSDDEFPIEIMDK